MSGRPWNTLLIAILLGLTSTRCGDTDPAGGTGAGASISTGLPADEKLSDLDDEDAKAACEALNDGAKELVSASELLRAQCAARAINTTAKVNAAKTEVSLDLAKCESVAANCEANPASFGLKTDTDADGNDCSKAVANQQVMSCEATVAQYEACVNKLLTQAKQGLASTTCTNAETLIKTDGAETKPDPQRIPECKLFQDKCPTVKLAVTVSK